ncbi:hypothetical protein HF325_001347 [Metschnikowia pulcherrima]|uniref:Mannosyltransferase n=1 Tax=Metschnikowia pulcherrima TaxID=27326 RepID=A0A8H7LD04_9ASCO|nr:hypothetical protein HF325_001347 [Metschnikowia pulcherrima]
MLSAAYYIFSVLLVAASLLYTQNAPRHEYRSAELNSLFSLKNETKPGSLDFLLHLNPFESSTIEKDDLVAKYGYDPALAGQQKLSSNSYFDVLSTQRDRRQVGRENATLVMLVRNLELAGALQSMRSLEDRFNRHYKYPWVFLNDVPLMMISSTKPRRWRVEKRTMSLSRQKTGTRRHI